MEEMKKKYFWFAIRILEYIFLPIIAIFVTVAIADSYNGNIKLMKSSMILFFLIAYVLILYDVIISETSILKIKIKGNTLHMENNFIMRKKWLRYPISILLKIIAPIIIFLAWHQTQWQLIFFTSIFCIIYYGYFGIKNTIPAYLYLRERKHLKPIKEIKYIEPKQMRRFIIESNEIVEII
jgi:hypothetical protein